MVVSNIEDKVHRELCNYVTIYQVLYANMDTPNAWQATDDLVEKCKPKYYVLTSLQHEYNIILF